MGSIVGGLVALGGAWVFGTQPNPFGLGLDEGSTAFWSGLLLNVGTTIALAFLLVAFERVIITQVRREGAAAIRLAKSTAEEVAGDVVDAKLAPIELRLDDFDATLRERAVQRQNSRLRAASKITSDTSFEAFAAALSAAAEINAITGVPGGMGAEGDSQIIVPGGTGFDAPAVMITHIRHASNGLPHIAFSVRRPSSNIDATASWRSDQALVDVFDALFSELIAQGAQDQVDLFEAHTLLQNVAYLLDAAISARHHEQGAWLSGNPAHEMISRECVITTLGIETQTEGLYVAKRRFGRYHSSRGSASNRLVDDDVPVDPPQGMSRESYARAVSRARGFLVGAPFSSLMRAST